MSQKKTFIRLIRTSGWEIRVGWKGRGGIKKKKKRARTSNKYPQGRKKKQKRRSEVRDGGWRAERRHDFKVKLNFNVDYWGDAEDVTRVPSTSAGLAKVSRVRRESDEETEKKKKSLLCDLFIPSADGLDWRRIVCFFHAAGMRSHLQSVRAVPLALALQPSFLQLSIDTTPRTHLPCTHVTWRQN